MKTSSLVFFKEFDRKFHLTAFRTASDTFGRTTPAAVSIKIDNVACNDYFLNAVEKIFQKTVYNTVIAKHYFLNTHFIQ